MGEKRFIAEPTVKTETQVPIYKSHIHLPQSHPVSVGCNGISRILILLNVSRRVKFIL